MLEMLGCNADVASDGIEAIESAQSNVYDLILMDLHMPRMDGLKATQGIRKLAGYSATPIVALTASALAEDRELCLEAGMNDHLGKPITSIMLSAMLGKWLPNLSKTVSVEATPFCDNALSRALTAIPGLEVGAIWLSSMEQITAYRSLLDRFIKTNAQDIAKLCTHLSAEERDAALIVAHSVKGVAGFIGARHIAALTGVIEEGLQKGSNTSFLADLASQCKAELIFLTEAFQKLPTVSAEPQACAE